MAQKIIYLEIQYGKMVLLGMVNPSTLKWSGPPRDIATNTFSVNLDTRSFALDDNYFNDGKILTGVKLFASNGLVRTKIYGRAIVKQSSQVIDSFAALESSKSLGGISNVVDVKNTTSGLHSQRSSLKITRSLGRTTHAIKFDTDSVPSNAGQGTVPYFDGSDIVQDFPLVLGGIGFIHYTNEGYGGYLRPILKSANMKHYV
jgi:hypothetical protein